MALKLLPIGISDFKTVIENNYYYIDKTLLVRDILERGQIILATRPRRFGKTLNLSMLRYFFEITEPSNAYLFKNTLIWQNRDDRAYQGQFPVIFLTFKSIKEDTWDIAYEKFEIVIYEEFKRHNYLLHDDSLESYDKELYQQILERKASRAELENSLHFLATLLHKKYNKKIVILIDEFDVPIQSAYINGYYSQAVGFMKGLLTTVLKDSNILEKGVITGILMLAKSGIFTGLNNLDVFNLTNRAIADKFGFTQDEVALLLEYYGIEDAETIKKWYDGYTFGDIKGIFNPWSTLQCIQNGGSLEKYWANTSDNALVKKLIARAPKSVKSELELLLEGQQVDQSIQESIIFLDLDHRPDLIWSLLLFTGYLTYSSWKLQEGTKVCSLIIPNKEIKYLYTELIRNIFQESAVGGQVQDLLEALTQVNAELFSELLQGFTINSMSFFDLPANQPEKSYHLFVLGLLVMLHDRYEVKSNRESGLGRYDVMIIPKQHNKPAIIIEFKKVIAGETLESAAQKALDQIKEKKYAQELQNRDFSKIFAYGIAVEGKKIFLKMVEKIK